MPLRVLSVSIVAASLMTLALAGAPAHAQSDVRPLLDRLDRVEREMTTLQRQVYRGGGGSSSSSQAAPVVGDSSDAIVSIQERLERIEGEMRRLTGKFEELGHAQTQTSQRIERMGKDNDLRFSEIEQKLSAAQTAAQGAQAGPVPQHNPPPELMQNSQAKPGEETIVLKPPAGADAGKGGTLQASQAAKPPPPAGQAPTTAASGNAQEQYDRAYAQLKGGNYEAAEKAFAAFVQAHPNDALAGNAQYWLGESFYVRGDHQKAAAAFAEGYLKYPKSPKASDNLLKLGLSLDQLGQKKEACASYARLEKEFKSVSGADAAKRKAASEMQRLNCK